MENNAYKKCEFIIRRFMSIGNPPPELISSFHAWLLDGRHCREKNKVLEQLFHEALSDVIPDPVDSHELVSALDRVS